MDLFRRGAPKTITAQIACLVVAAVLLGVGLSSGVLLYLLYSGQPGAPPRIAADMRAARIAAVVKEAEAAGSTAELDQALEAARRHSPAIRLVAISGLAAAPHEPSRDPAFVRSVKIALQDAWGLAPLPNPSGPDEDDSLAFKVSDDSALVFEVPPPRAPFHNLVLVQTICALAIVTFIILFLCLYAVRWITSPLSSIASAARSFGHSPAEDQTLTAGGPREIAQVAEALNDMRKRVRSLVDERTQMLVAISHDLRTPLTRLRLRAERLTDAAVRDGMLQDIATANDMLGETLIYLREGGRLESVHLVDLPSLLQTICAQFADVGHNVSYEGPARLAFACRPHALNRAVTNVVDNAAKHGGVVVVTLRAVDEASAEIEVSDDGPGIPASLREKVFEPFFKGDSARPAVGRGGFGLGLSIAREIVLRHGGAIALADHVPKGLTVRLSVSALPGAKAWDFAAADPSVNASERKAIAETGA